MSSATNHSIKNTTEESDRLSIEFNQLGSSKFHYIWLRDNCHCDKCYYDVTKQRLVNSCQIDLDIKPKSVSSTDSKLQVIWPDDHNSTFEADWLALHSYNPVLVKQKVPALLEQQLWQVADIKDNLPKVNFNDVMEKQEAVNDWILKIHKHGFCFVDDVPVNPEDTEKLCNRLDYIRPTHYGAFWDFTSDLSKNDTAYTNFDISSHTDGTYWSDTPGLQLFHLLYHDGQGGTTSLVDAFKCAQIMKEKYPESFEFLTKLPIPAHSAGEETVLIQPDIPQPIFKLNQNGELIQVRWNLSDRSTMNTWANPEEVPMFYKAIKQWYSIITDKENEFFYQLQPGQVLIFDNWRLFHSRTEFTGKRRMCGAYFNRDDFISKVKLLDIGREKLLKTL